MQKYAKKMHIIKNMQKYAQNMHQICSALWLCLLCENMQTKCKKYAIICKICQHDFLCKISTPHFADGGIQTWSPGAIILAERWVMGSLGWSNNSARLALQERHTNVLNIILPFTIFPFLLVHWHTVQVDLWSMGWADNTWSVFCLLLVSVRDLITVANHSYFPSCSPGDKDWNLENT